MGGAPGELKGPDFTSGVPLEAIPDGGLLLGHAQGEAVLLVRRGQEVLGVSATCPHYGAPLADGVVVGDTIRCPWHHAGFDLRTGEASRPPAINPIACWKVERRGTQVAVTGKADAPAPRPPPPSAPSSVVIVGAGAAGNIAAETLRHEGYTGPITLIGADPSGPYDRPNLSKDYLAGNAPEEWIPLRGPEFYADKRITLRVGTRVAAVDPQARRVTLEGGETLDYGALILATGATPIPLTVPGAELPHVFTLRTLADSRAIIARAQGAKQAVVVGAGFIALEVAAALRTRGVAVHVVAPDARPLGKVLGPEVGDFLRALHEEHGVVFHFGQAPSAIDPQGVTLTSGERLAADLVVAGIGVRPEVALARQAGLEVDNGVLVDTFLQTSQPGIYAVGDIARYPDARSGQRLRIEHWAVAGRQGKTAARNVLGRREPFDAVPFFWSAHYDVVLAYVGHGVGWERAEVSGSLAGRSATITYRREGKVVAVATLFRDRESLEIEAAMEAGDPARVEALVAG